ncbi:AEC family transporter [Candidatus Auribacterota bacterium]
MFTQVISKIFIMILLVSAGYVLDKKRFVSREALQSLSRIVIYVMLPALIFSSIITQFDRGTILSGWILPFLGAMTFLIGSLVGWLNVLILREKKGVRRNTVIYLLTINNYGFVSIPLVYMLFGEGAVALLFLHNLGCEIVFWTLGIWLLKGDGFSVKSFRSLANPPFTVLVASILIVLFGVKYLIPGFVVEACDILGKGLIPLIMLVIGSILAEIRFNDGGLFDKTLIFVMVCRLLIVPLIVVGILFIIPLPVLYRNIAVIVAVMPSASSSPLFTKQFGGDTPLAAKAVFFTTIFSVVTVPVFLAIFLR